MRLSAIKAMLAERDADAYLIVSLIPTCLSNDCFDPVSLGDRSDLFWHLHELVPGVSAGGKNFVVAVPDLMAQEVAAQKLPDVFDWVELWGIGRQR